MCIQTKITAMMRKKRKITEHHIKNMPLSLSQNELNKFTNISLTVPHQCHQHYIHIESVDFFFARFFVISRKKNELMWLPRKFLTPIWLKFSVKVLVFIDPKMKQITLCRKRLNFCITLLFVCSRLEVKFMRATPKMIQIEN